MTIEITAFSAYESAKRLKTRVANKALTDRINMRANVSACEAVLGSIEKEAKGLRAYMKNLEDSAREMEARNE